MWQNLFRRTRVGGLYSVYEIKGLNLDRLLNVYQKHGIDLFDVKKYSNKRIRVRVKYGDGKKLFAITEEMCYNIKKVRDTGGSYPLLYLYRNIGVLIGLIFFLTATIVANDYVFAIDYSGSGSVYRREVDAYLAQKGVGVYSKFSDIDLDALGEEIMAVSPRLSFAECTKDGNRLRIELAVSKKPPQTLTGTATALVTDTDGVVEQVRVYRGTAEVSVGDSVKSGDLLVGGYYVVNEERVPQNVIASVAVRVEKSYEYLSANDGEEDLALLFAEQALNILQPTHSTVEKTKTKNGYIYTVTLYSRRVFTVG